MRKKTGRKETAVATDKHTKPGTCPTTADLTALAAAKTQAAIEAVFRHIAAVASLNAEEDWYYDDLRVERMAQFFFDPKIQIPRSRMN